ncbi:MAG: L,D-transpeptidase [Planctomycetota bacterium]
MRRRTRRRLLWLTGLAIAAVAIALGVTLTDGDESEAPADGGDTPAADIPPADASPAEAPSDDGDGHGEGGATTAPAPKPSPKIPPSGPPMAERDARRAYDEGMQLVEDGKLIDARTKLSAAVFSDHLPEEHAEKARQTLWELARRTIFSSRAYPDDPYTLMYRFKRGDRLADKRVNGKAVPGIVNGMDLRVPAAAILLANGIPASKLQAGGSYKLIRGPFHVTVHKSKFVMDVFLQRAGEDWPRTFVRRLPVGLGRNGSTPVGSWVVDAKARRAAWYPPPETGLRGPIHPGDPDYAFGEKGLWISMKGIDKNTRGHDGYGIHSTDDPSSIGEESSLGCIRLPDEGIDFVYKVLYEGHSTVYIRP